MAGYGVILAGMHWDGVIMALEFAGDSFHEILFQQGWSEIYWG
jgi:hypothetical protein